MKGIDVTASVPEGSRDVEESLVESFGRRVGEAMGWPPMAGRAAGALMLSERPLTMAELQERLGFGDHATAHRQRSHREVQRVRSASVRLPLASRRLGGLPRTPAADDGAAARFRGIGRTRRPGTSPGAEGASRTDERVLPLHGRPPRRTARRVLAITDIRRRGTVAEVPAPGRWPDPATSDRRR